jgi:hypothetical protein
VAGMAICPHHLPGRIPQSLAGAYSMGVGVFDLRQRRTSDHAQLSIGTQASGVKAVVMSREVETSQYFSSRGKL